MNTVASLPANEIAGVRDTLIVAANNPVSHGGLKGLRQIMLTQAARLADLASPAVEGDAESMAQHLIGIAYLMRRFPEGYGRMVADADRLDNAAALIRRLATPEQPGPINQRPEPCDDCHEPTGGRHICLRCAEHRTESVASATRSTQPEARGVECECKPSALGGMVPGCRVCCAATPNPVRAEQPEGKGAYPTGSDREVLNYLMQQFDFEVWNCPQCGHAEDCADMDSADYLRRYLASAPAAPVGVDLGNWAAHYSIGPAALEALRGLLALSTPAPAAPGAAVGCLLPRETLYAALRELIHRIEVCGASPELTKASSLACDLMDTVGNQFNAPRPDAVERVTAALAGKDGA